MVSNAEIRVFQNFRDDAKCNKCGKDIKIDEFITLANGQNQIMCIVCSELDDLVYLPSGDSIVTRRARKYSSKRAGVYWYNRSRKRCERQGSLVEGEALKKAREESEEDSQERAIRRKRNARRRAIKEFHENPVARLNKLLRKNYPMYYLNPEKLRERAIPTDEIIEGGWKVILVKRHRAILGVSYQEGSPMSCFETYYQRFAIHPEIDDVQELSDKHIDYSIDIGDLVSEHLSELGLIYIASQDEADEDYEDEFSDRLMENDTAEVLTGKKRYVESSVFGFKEIVTSLEEAKAIVCSKMIDVHVTYFKEMVSLLEGFSEKETDELVKRYQEELEESLIMKVEYLW